MHPRLDGQTGHRVVEVIGERTQNRVVLPHGVQHGRLVTGVQLPHREPPADVRLEEPGHRMGAMLGDGHPSVARLQ